MQRWLIIVGVALVAIGVVWPLLRRLGVGRLPGDILIQKEGFTLYIPITTMLIASIVISLILWFLDR